MKRYIYVICTVSLLFAVVQSSSAQKFAHVSSAVLLQAHPKVAMANTELEAFQKSVMDPFQAKVKAFQSKAAFFQEEVNAGTLSKVSAQTRQEQLQKEQQDLSTEEQQIQFSVMQKREALLQPILMEVDSIIQVVGKEGKYTMIFDNSVPGAILYAPDSEDLTETVKARMKQ